MTDLPYAMHSLEEWRAYTKFVSHNKFLENYSHPFLVALNSFREAEGNDATNDFFTLVGDEAPITGSQNATKIQQVYEVKKKKRLYSPRISIGRAGNNDIVLDLIKISKFHAFFIVDQEEKKYFLVDANSTNKTWINQTRLESSKPVEIFDKDTINLGQAIDFRFYLPPSFYNYLRLDA